MPLTTHRAGARARLACTALPGSRHATLVLALTGALAPGVRAQTASVDTGLAARLPFTIVPAFSALETYTRNDALTPGRPRSDLITQLSPGLRLRLDSGRIRGSVDYALNTYFYARDTDQNNIQHALNASINAEAIPNFAYFDASAGISQQVVSPLGQQFSSGTLSTANRTEVRTYSLSPYIRGTLSGGLVEYQARVSHSQSTSNAAFAGNSADSALLQLNGGAAFSLLRWSITGSHNGFDFSAGRRSADDRLDLGISYLLTPQLTLSVSAGRESTDYLTVTRQTTTTAGAGVAWQPSELTSLRANLDHRAYGNTHALNFSHRTGRTVWSYSDTRSVSNGAGQQRLFNLGTTYDLFYALSTEPDPVLRQQQVLALLRQRGIDPAGIATASFLTSALTIERRQLLAAALQGVRSSVALSISRSQSRHLDTVAGLADPLAGSATLRQQALSINLGHRLTPTASLNFNASQQRVQGIDVATGAASSTRLKSVDLGWSDQVGRRTRVSVTARRSLFDSATAPYAETALTAGVTLTF